MGIRADFVYEPQNIPQQELNSDYQKYLVFAGGVGTIQNFDRKVGKRFYIYTIVFTSNGTTDQYTLSDSTQNIVSITSHAVNNEEKVIFFQEPLIFLDEINITVSLVTGGGAPTQRFTFKGYIDES